MKTIHLYHLYTSPSEEHRTWWSACGQVGLLRYLHSWPPVFCPSKVLLTVCSVLRCRESGPLTHSLSLLGNQWGTWEEKRLQVYKSSHFDLLLLDMTSPSVWWIMWSLPHHPAPRESLQCHRRWTDMKTMSEWRVSERFYCLLWRWRKDRSCGHVQGLWTVEEQITTELSNNNQTSWGLTVSCTHTVLCP